MNDETRRKKSYWRRQRPAPRFDLSLLRPKYLSKAKRFETKKDSRDESRRSQALLKGLPPSTMLAECLAEYFHCERPSCPICSRIFRRWFVGQLLRLQHNQEDAGHTATILLQEFHDDRDIKDINLAAYSHALRKRLARSGLGDAVVIGGYELSYRARTHSWIFHIHLAIFGARASAVATLKESFDDSSLLRPEMIVPIRNPVEQLSYIMKFVTYHRPGKQYGPSRSRARPLNRKQHIVLVRWLHQHEFSDFLFLFNARRHGATIFPRSHRSLAEQVEP